MGTDEKQVKIIAELHRGVFSGRMFKGDTVRDLCYDGENRIPWTPDLLKKIFQNYQIDTKENDCQIILLSDALLVPEDVFPQFDHGHPPKISELSRFVLERNVKTYGWMVNNQKVEDLGRLFPTSTDPNAGQMYLYTVPAFELPTSITSDIGLEDAIMQLLKMHLKEQQLSPMADVDNKQGTVLEDAFHALLKSMGHDK